MGAIRDFLRDTPLLYQFYISLRKSDKVIFPSKKTQLHLTGFPRSANTFCMNIVKATFPDLQISTHIHTISSLKLAIRYSVPTIIIVRDPTDACLSLNIKMGASNNILKKLLKDYINYHSFVLKKKHYFKVARFEEVTNSPENILVAVCETLSIPKESIDLHKSTQAGVHSALVKETAKPTYGSSMPNEERKKIKSDMMAQLDPALIPLVERAQLIYRSLLMIS